MFLDGKVFRVGTAIGRGFDIGRCQQPRAHPPLERLRFRAAHAGERPKADARQQRGQFAQLAAAVMGDDLGKRLAQERAAARGPVAHPYRIAEPARVVGEVGERVERIAAALHVHRHRLRPEGGHGEAQPHRVLVAASGENDTAAPGPTRPDEPDADAPVVLHDRVVAESGRPRRCVTGRPGQDRAQAGAFGEGFGNEDIHGLLATSQRHSDGASAPAGPGLHHQLLPEC